jgi:tRNA(Phe) wybutosine-synthesizing methylase Tyw3
MEEYIEDAIAVYYGRIQEYEYIKKQIERHITDKLRFRVETKQWYGFDEPFSKREKHKLNISKEAMQDILDLAIEKERENINKLIDAEIELRRKEEEKNEVNRNSKKNR